MRELSNGQRDALLFGAVAGPMAIVAGGKSLLWGLPALALAAVAYYVLRNMLPEGHGLAEYMPVWILIPELLFLILAAARTSGYIASCWPGKGVWPLFPIVLLVLGGAASWQDTDGIGRCAVLLGGGCAVFYGLVFGAGVLEPGIKLVEGTWNDGLPILLTGLTAVCGLFLPAQKGGGKLWAGISMFTVLLLIMTGGKDGGLPLLTAVKGITLFGVLQRFEALVSCMITVGLFLVLALIAGAGGEIVRELGVPQLRGFAVIVPALGIVWWINDVNPVLFMIASGVFWGLIPLITLPVVIRKRGQKNMKKDEKSS